MNYNGKGILFTVSMNAGSEFSSSLIHLNKEKSPHYTMMLNIARLFYKFHLDLAVSILLESSDAHM